MAARCIFSRTSNSLTPALLGLAFVLVVREPLSEAPEEFRHFICALTSEFLKLLLASTLAAYQALAGYVLDHQQLLACFDTLVSSWSLLRFILGAL